MRASDGSLVVQLGVFGEIVGLAERKSMKKRVRDESVEVSEEGVKAAKELHVTRRPDTSRLSDATWTRTQDMVVAAKSLRKITQVVLAFFKEQEIAQVAQTGLRHPIYPIMVPISEVYAMIAPRKRRAYDVLHVLEGIGVLKRVREDETKTTRIRTGHFLYCGIAGTMERLESIQLRTRKLCVEAIASNPLVTRQQLDTVLMLSCNVQSQVEGWPHLATATVAFLSLLLASNDPVDNSLCAVSTRVVEARLGIENGLGEGIIQAEVNRRLYDVVAVLATVNVITLPTLSESLKNKCRKAKGRATPRKGVLFHSAVFRNPALLRIGDMDSKRLLLTFENEPDKKSRSRSKDKVSPSIDEIELRVGQPQCYGVENGWLALEDLFPEVAEIDDVDSQFVEWWSLPLRELLLRDALNSVDFLDWEIMQAMSRAQKRVKTPSNKAASPDQEDHVDLMCYETLRDA